MPVLFLKLPMLWSHCCDPLCSAASYSPVPELLLLPGKCGTSSVAPTLVSMQLPLAAAEECDTPSAVPLRTCAADSSPAFLKTQLVVSLLCI